METSLLRIKDVYGVTCYVARVDYENEKRTQLPLYFKTGRKFSDAVCPRCLHHDPPREHRASVRLNV